MELDKFNWITDDIRTFVSRGYIDETISLEERYYNISKRFEEISKIEGIGDKIYDYFSKNLISLSSPILSNFGTNDGLPISCNFGVVNDTLQDIVYGEYEMSMLAKNGAGTAKNFSPIRPLGEKYGKDKLGISPGAVSWIQSYAQKITKLSQGGMRRGFLTAYLNMEHGDIDSFLNIGMDGDPKADIGYSIQNITTGVTLSEGYIEDIKRLQETDPSLWTIEERNKLQMYAKLIKRRSQKGFPYILFEDNCNKNKPQVYKDKNMHLHTSNICTEVIEYCDEFKEFACCLLSLNLAHYDEWPADLIETAMIMLDCVITEYIDKAKHLPGLEKAVRFAEEHRAVGLGVLGFHSYLQQKSIVWGSLESYQINNIIFKRLFNESLAASKLMASKWGEPEMLKGYGERNTTRIAIAPTKSTAEIMGGWSQGIQPIKSNYHEKTNAKHQTTYKNPELIKVLTNYKLNNRETWKSILANNGSVQHLEELSQHDRDVFKTFSEISQVDIIKLAGQRQRYIDQGQSINLQIHPDASANDIHNLILLAHEEGLKTLYYQYSISASQNFNQSLLTCTACEG